MKRNECTKESLCERGWKTCYSEESNHTTQYTYDEVVQAVQSGAPVRKEVSVVTQMVFIYIDGRAMLCREATDEEVAKQREVNEQERYEKALKRINARNRSRMWR